ncbi:MAG: flagellin [Sphingomonadales bacterium]|nr:flagellin [Sphingomonadales bacterium]
MSSINTNVAAMTALQTLTQTNKMLTETQNRVSTGFRVNDASDNAAYWSIATTMRSDNKALGAVQDALGLGAATVDTAYTGVKAAIEVVDEIKSKLVTARGEGVDRAKIQTEITQLQDQLTGIASSAVISGADNWLSVDSSVAGYSDTKSVVSSFTRTGGAVTIQTIDIDTGGMNLFDSGAGATEVGIIDGLRDATGAIAAAGFSIATLDISALTNSAADLTTLETYILGADSALSEMTDAATDLGSTKSRIGLQQDFVKNLMDAIDRGVGQLVDADMNEESVKLQALQVKQQLGIQALSIANSNGQSILSLFR